MQVIIDYLKAGKGKKDISKLVKKQIVDKKNRLTWVYVNPNKEKKSLVDRILDFFGFKVKKEYDDYIERTYTEYNIKDKFGVNKDTYELHLREYLADRDKWDALIEQKTKGKKTSGGEKGGQKSGKEETSGSDTGKSTSGSDKGTGKKEKIKISLELMRFIRDTVIKNAKKDVKVKQTESEEGKQKTSQQDKNKKSSSEDKEAIKDEGNQKKFVEVGAHIWGTRKDILDYINSLKKDEYKPVSSSELERLEESGEMYTIINKKRMLGKVEDFAEEMKSHGVNSRIAHFAWDLLNVMLPKKPEDTQEARMNYVKYVERAKQILKSFTSKEIHPHEFRAVRSGFEDLMKDPIMNYVNIHEYFIIMKYYGEKREMQLDTKYSERARQELESPEYFEKYKDYLEYEGALSGLVRDYGDTSGKSLTDMYEAIKDKYLKQGTDIDILLQTYWANGRPKKNILYNEKEYYTKSEIKLKRRRENAINRITAKALRGWDYQYNNYEWAKGKEQSKTDEKRKENEEKKEKGMFKWEVIDNPKYVRISNLKKKNYEDSETFKNEFKFKNVQYGVYVDEESRKIHTQRTGEAFDDMCHVLGLKPNDVTINGQLAIAFGARGKGKANAHYETGRKIINITKYKGDGTLAHEWMHFIDNLLNIYVHNGKYDGNKYVNANLSDKISEYIIREKAYTIFKKNSYLEKIKTEMQQYIDNPEEIEKMKNLVGAYYDVMVAILYGDAEKKVGGHTILQKYKIRRKGYKYQDNIGANIKIDEAIKAVLGDKAQAIVDAMNAKKETKNFENFFNYLSKEEIADIAAETVRRIGFKDLKSSKAKSFADYVLSFAKKIEPYEEIEIPMKESVSRTMFSSIEYQAKYYAKPCELLARAFQGYLYDKLDSNNMKNTYLVSEEASEETQNKLLEMTEKHFGTKYCLHPVGDERKVINEKFEVFFNLLKENDMLRKAIVVFESYILDREYKRIADVLAKATKDKSKLVKKVITDKKGRTTTVYIKPEDEKGKKDGNKDKEKKDTLKNELREKKKEQIKNLLKDLLDSWLKQYEGEGTEHEVGEAMGKYGEKQQEIERTKAKQKDLKQQNTINKE